MKELQTELNKWLNEWEEKATMDLRNKIPFFMQHCAGYYDIVAGTSPLLLPKAKANGLKSVIAYGATEQSGTPTPDNPVDIVSNNGVLKYSANMANVNEQTALIGYYISSSGVITADQANWIYQDFIPVRPNTTYTLTMSSSVYYVTISEYSTADDSGFIVRNAGSTGENTTLTITTGSTTNFVRFGTNIDRTEVTLEEVLAINWMLNEGGTAIPYAPYAEGGIYTDGTVETIWAHGKNLFNYDQDISVESVSSGGIWQRYNVSINLSVGNWYAKKITNVNAGTYIASVYTSSGLVPFGNIFVYDGTQTTKYSSGSAITVTKPSEIWFMGGSSSSWNTIIKAQFERGSTITDWEPYFNGGQATAEMLLKVGDYQDTQEVIAGSVTRNVGIKIFDGTELISASSDNSYFAYAAEDKASGFISSVPLPISTHFQTAPNTGTDSIPDNGIGASSTTSNKSIWFKMSAAQNVTAFKTFLAEQYAAGTPVIVVYPLATPTTETVAGQILNTQEGSNYLTITQASLKGLTLEAKYKRSK